ncbi:MAG: chemotaxis protein CheD [Nitrospiraceae bacterium]|nr:chemotaxis protein CheD [Nitrospiraceae bacterium]
MTGRSRLPLVYLRPGELAIFEERARVTTVLGSCVSVTMYCRRTGAAAICHSTLPECGRENMCAGYFCANAFRYVTCSLRFMLSTFEAAGVSPGELEVKLFGGADSIGSANSVGKRNVSTALKLLKAAGLAVSASDTGDSQGRKIIFFPHTGEVLLKRLKGGAAVHGYSKRNVRGGTE